MSRVSLVMSSLALSLATLSCSVCFYLLSQRDQWVQPQAAMEDPAQLDGDLNAHRQDVTDSPPALESDFIEAYHAQLARNEELLQRLRQGSW